MRAMILAAGLGTRLRPLTEELPKPLVWVGDRSILAHVADHLAAGGIEAAVINTHHLAEAFADRVHDVSIPIHVIHEPRILGTAGGVANVAEWLGEGDVLVCNADVLSELDVAAFVAAHRRIGAAATLAVALRPIGEGPVGLGRSGEIVRLRSLSVGEEASGADFLGTQLLTPRVRASLPREGCLVGDVYMRLLERGERLATFVVDSFVDIGTIAAYLAANRDWLARRSAVAHVGAGASIAPGVLLEQSVVGEGAVIAGTGALVRCVVWPFATAEAPLEDAVVTTAGKVVFG